MSYQIELAEDSRREIKALPAYVRAQALAHLRELANTPRPHRAKELDNKPGSYRIWLSGRWRIVYTVDDEHQVVTILRVRHKDEIDYESLDVPLQPGEE